MISAILYVDDNDLFHINMDQKETLDKAFNTLQESVISSDELLIATGGSLKPVKCFYSIIAFCWDDRE